MSKLETRRFDAKLDSFLRRRLPQEDFEKISTSEPCVILSPEDKRVHRHAVLGHRCVYFTEVPPKNIKIALYLKDVTSIRMLDDLPDFLSGSEQENTVHIQIDYRRLCKEKKKSPSILKKLGKGGTDQTQIQKSPQSTSPLTTFQISASSPDDSGVISSRHESTLSLNSASPDYVTTATARSHSSLSYYSPAVGKRSPQFVAGDSGPQERSRSLSPVPTEDLYSYRKSPLLKHRIPPSVTLSSRRGGPIAGSPQFNDQTHSNSFTNCHKEKVVMDGHLQPGAVTEGAQSSGNFHNDVNSREIFELNHRGSSMMTYSAHLADSRSSVNHSPLSPDIAENGTSSSEQLNKWRKNHVHVDHKSPALTLKRHQHSSSPNFFSSSTDSLGGGGGSSGKSGSTYYSSSNNLSMKLSGRQDSSLSLLSVASWTGGALASISGGEESCACKQEAAVMDLYILKQSSDFYHHLCVAWVNVKINKVYSLDEDESPTLAKSFRYTHDHFSQKFCTLKQELLTTSSVTGSRLEASARLAQELCSACEKYFIIKRLFWEDSELFEFCLSQLKAHLPSSEKKTKGRLTAANRGDQLEYSLILMDLFYQVMRETQLFGKKLVMLTRNGGQLLLGLAIAVVHHTPPPMSNDSEYADLDAELTEKSCAILYELTQVTQQARWPLAKKTVISPTWLVEALAADSAIKSFCARMVSYASHVIGRGTTASSSAVDFGPSLGAELDPQAQITLYHLATVMNTLVQNSSTIVQLLRANFTEEFRYFIRVSKAQKVLPLTCALSRDTLELLGMIKSKVLS